MKTVGHQIVSPSFATDTPPSSRHDIGRMDVDMMRTAKPPDGFHPSQSVSGGLATPPVPAILGYPPHPELRLVQERIS